MSDFNERVIAEFRENEGRVGGPFASMPLVLLHHRGAKSGVERVSPLARPRASWAATTTTISGPASRP